MTDVTHKVTLQSPATLRPLPRLLCPWRLMRHLPFAKLAGSRASLRQNGGTAIKLPPPSFPHSLSVGSQPVGRAQSQSAHHSCSSPLVRPITKIKPHPFSKQVLPAAVPDALNTNGLRLSVAPSLQNMEASLNPIFTLLSFTVYFRSCIALFLRQSSPLPYS